MLPISTAIWDPLWFHNGTSRTRGEFRDKNGIWNGVRIPILSPATLESGLCNNSNNCKPDSCEFLRKYREYLNSLDFDKLYLSLEKLSDAFMELEKLSEDPHLVLMVHEKPDNPCSEREALQEYFNSHGIYCEELNYPIK